MSLYCTLPRNSIRDSYSSLSTASTTSSSIQPSQDFQLTHSFNNSNSDVISVRSTQSELCLNTKSNCDKLKVYYAVDNFEDLKKIRRSSVSSFESEVNFSSPNFYGDNDSAYNSSQESIKASHRSLVNRVSTNTKYFTLPSRINRRAKKAASIESVFSEVKVEQVKQVNKPSDIVTSNQVNDYATVSNDTSNSFHCCCLLGCHSKDKQLMVSSSFEKNHKLHCCQNRLETVWEEPHSNGTANEVSLF